MASLAQTSVQVYELDYHRVSHGFFFALNDAAWSFGSWSSDARVLYCRFEKEKLSHLVVIDGTHVTWHGQPLLKVAGPMEYFEWRGEDAVTNAAPNKSSVTSLFDELTNRSSSPYAEKH